MLTLKTLHKWGFALALVILLSSFYNASNAKTNFDKVQTEIIVSDTNQNESTVDYCDAKHYRSQYVTVNQFTVFNFKSLLKSSNLNFSITLKTQKQAVFQFLDGNSILKQNLIAYQNASHSYDALVK